MLLVLPVQLVAVDDGRERGAVAEEEGEIGGENRVLDDAELQGDRPHESRCGDLAFRLTTSLYSSDRRQRKMLWPSC